MRLEATRRRSRSSGGRRWPPATRSAATATIRASWATERRTSSAGKGRRSPLAECPSKRRGGNNSASVRPAARTISCAAHPAKQCTKTRPSSSSRIANDGPRSSCAGHRAVHLSPPVLRTASTRSSNVAALIARPLRVRRTRIGGAAPQTRLPRTRIGSVPMSSNSWRPQRGRANVSNGARLRYDGVAFEPAVRKAGARQRPLSPSPGTSCGPPGTVATRGDTGL